VWLEKDWFIMKHAGDWLSGMSVIVVGVFVATKRSEQSCSHRIKDKYIVIYLPVF
jgi:hypothetical protein